MGQLSRRVRRLEERLGAGRQEEQLFTQEQWDEATKRLTEDELAAIEEAQERFDGQERIPVEELTDRELWAYYRLYNEMAGGANA